MSHLFPGTSASASAVPRAAAPKAVRKTRGAQLDSELNHPLLGDEPTLKLMPDREEVQGEWAEAVPGQGGEVQGEAA